jgi:uncharacterized membrane protein (UPF0127 family)
MAAGSPSKRFLAGVATAGPPPKLVNGRTERVLASAVELAVTSETRRRGLLGRDSLDPAVAILIAPSSAIHTFFMRFPIDVVFVDRGGRVLKVVRNLRAWRMAGSLRAHAVVEMNAGSLGPDDVTVGDQLRLDCGQPEVRPI